MDKTERPPWTCAWSPEDLPEVGNLLARLKRLEGTEDDPPKWNSYDVHEEYYSTRRN